MPIGATQRRMYGATQSRLEAIQVQHHPEAPGDVCRLPGAVQHFRSFPALAKPSEATRRRHIKAIRLRYIFLLVTYTFITMPLLNLQFFMLLAKL